MVDSFGKIKTINTEKINSKTTRNTMGVTVWRSEKEGFKIVSANILK
jgi:hypothetical protein